MRLTLRFVLPLILILSLIAYLVTPLTEQLIERWFMRDLDIRTTLIANTLQEPLAELLKQPGDKLSKYLQRLTQDERLYAVGFCLPGKSQAIKTPTFPDISCQQAQEGFKPDSEASLHITVRPLFQQEQLLGRLIFVHDVRFIQRRSAETKLFLFYLFLVLGIIISLVTVLIAQLSRRNWIQGTRALLRGEVLGQSFPQKSQHAELNAIAGDVKLLLRELEAEYHQRDQSQISWTPETLRNILKQELRGEEIIVVSNREPYIHVQHEGRIEVQQPASGLVTAMEPIMRACSGTWIAHGSGSADRQVVDQHDHVAVPPEQASYQLRRLWLSPEEEQGYYYGFANEGLWPLCHIAHVRPSFRASDWQYYVTVNQKFAQAVIEEASSENPIVLIQDYHFALLPRMIRQKLPQATIITFWHIPWPNPEAFAICPWRAELLDGLLGSSILGFHTQFHCNNFVDTVDRMLEARIDRETFSISYGGHPTAVHRYPISIDWPPAPVFTAKPISECRQDIRQRHGLSADHLLGFGIDRLDYTKGILERFLAVERLLELYPQWLGRFSFVQVAAPSRSHIAEYQAFGVQVRELAERINTRFGKGAYQPIILKIEHHEHAQVYEYYRASELCFVSSLHDGMNLVAKEFLAARDDEQGVLLLSQFTGASRELPEALIVNPYDVDQCAVGLHLALSMSPKEQRERLRIMRGLISEFNVYRWAGRMLLDAAMMRKRDRLLAHGSSLQKVAVLDVG